MEAVPIKCTLQLINVNNSQEFHDPYSAANLETGDLTDKYVILDEDEELKHTFKVKNLLNGEVSLLHCSEIEYSYKFYQITDIEIPFKYFLLHPFKTLKAVRAAKEILAHKGVRILNILDLEDPDIQRFIDNKELFHGNKITTKGSLRLFSKKEVEEFDENHYISVDLATALDTHFDVTTRIKEYYSGLIFKALPDEN